MIANARMYSVTPQVSALWRRLLEKVVNRSALPIAIVDHRAPAPISELWLRPDKSAVFMCGLPFSVAHPQPYPVVAPVPAPEPYGGRACYWSEFVVRTDSAFQTLEDTFGRRIAFTTRESQSGFVAALSHLMKSRRTLPLYREVIAPRITPMGAIKAVIEGAADVAPLDSYAFDLLRKYEPELTSQVRVVERTEPTPVPLLVASGPPTAELVAAFTGADRDPDLRSIMNDLLLERFVEVPSGTYDSLRQSQAAAEAFWRSHRLAEMAHPAFGLSP